jgi:glycosyltransferase involved in cell wall biosynthesis
MDDRIELCFCIPTYNRAESVYRLVSDLLSCKDEDIHVVVLDNGSSDNTLELLHTIADVRLDVDSNGENRGALYNMIHVLDRGVGRYVVYSTDQDYIDVARIPEFKSFLRQHPGLACGFCMFDTDVRSNNEIFAVGYQSVKRIAYKGRHPTGYFFNNSMLKSVDITHRFSDYDFVDLFPLEFVFAELCLLGNGAIYHNPLFIPKTGESIVSHKSSTTHGKSRSAFFLPESRLKIAVNYALHIDTLRLRRTEKNLLIVDAFFNGLDAATIGYRSILADEHICSHYYMEPRTVGVGELFEIGTRFYRQFVVRTQDLYKGTFSRPIIITVMITLRVLYKIIYRCLR